MANNRAFRAVIFTDLDGTLLDFTTYAWKPAEPAIRAAVARGHPLIFCSSKTRAEQLVIQRDMGIAEPFITENGSAIFIPRAYFAHAVPGARPADSPSQSGARERFADAPTEFTTARGRLSGAASGSHAAEPLQERDAPFDVVELGAPAAHIRATLQEIRRDTGLSFRGYGDLSLDELVEVTGLDPAAAQRAGCREYSETIIDLNESSEESFSTALAARGLACFPGGRFHTVTSADTDKGRAVRLLAESIRREAPAAETIGIGDSPNDRPMLEAVERAFLVQRPDGTWSDVGVRDLQRVDGIGPEGWRRVVLSLIIR